LLADAIGQIDDLKAFAAKGVNVPSFVFESALLQHIECRIEYVRRGPKTMGYG